MAMPHGLSTRDGYFRPGAHAADPKSVSIWIWAAAAWTVLQPRWQALLHRPFSAEVLVRRAGNVAGGFLLVSVAIVAMAALIAVVVAGTVAVVLGFLTVAAVL